MTEPIINGVDVSGCIHYKNQTCIANYLFTNIPFSEAKCEISPNCHYKQLKRKEQKCEKYEACLGYILILAEKIFDYNRPACKYTSGCPLNGGTNISCDFDCPHAIAKKIISKINEVEK